MDGEKCPVCGKLFFPTPLWVYKLTVKGKLKYFCSYTCYRKIQTQQPSKIKARRSGY